MRDVVLANMSLDELRKERARHKTIADRRGKRIATLDVEKRSALRSASLYDSEITRREKVSRTGVE